MISKRSVIAGVLAISLIGNAILLLQSYRRDIVSQVVDGDTLQLADGRRVRLRSIDAPEKDRCMATEARSTLETIALHKHIRLEETLTDTYGRILAVAFIGSTNLNQLLAKNGLARHFSSGSNYDNLLSNESNSAKKSGMGIYSDTCRSSDPHDSCTIKGNLRSGVKTYYLPSCDAYDQVIVDEAYGDQWFCTEKEAIDTGFGKAKGCN